MLPVRLVRPARLRAWALLLVGVTTAGVLTQAGIPAGAAQDPAGRVKAAQTSVADLRALVQESVRELRAATAEFEQTQARADALQAEADRTREAAQAAQRASAAARAELAAVVVRNFMDPPPSTLSAVLSADKGDLSEAVLAAHDREVLVGNQRDLLRKADAARVKAESLIAGAEQLAVDALRSQRAAAAQEQSVRELAERNEAKLTKAFAELEKAQAAKRAYDAEQARLREIARQKALAAAAARERAEAARRRENSDAVAECSGSSTAGYPNGFIPDSALCSIGGGQMLRADAAAAFLRMDAAYGGLCVTDSYRSYAAQVDVFARKPNLAAIPGTSKHGLGIALDLCGGVNRFGSAAHQWMVDNAGRFGWWHPYWARQGGSMPEPWHWEFTG